jgi:hypothetical protein
MIGNNPYVFENDSSKKTIKKKDENTDMEVKFKLIIYGKTINSQNFRLDKDISRKELHHS